MNKIFLIFIILGILFPIFLINAQDSFIEDLYFGIRNDSEVIKLQEFLTDEGLYSGPITGNFFSLTLKAVKTFQIREGITPTAGFFGPKTRTRANEILSSQIKASEEQAISETGAIPESPTLPKTTDDVIVSLQSQINILLQQIVLLQQQIQSQKQVEQQITQQTQIIQQQQTTLEQIQQNTAPSPAPTSSPYQPTAIIIKKVDDTYFSITNSGPDTIRIKKVILSNPSMKITDYTFSSSGWSFGFAPFVINGITYNRLECNGLGSLGTYRCGATDCDPCARPYAIKDKIPLINELLPQETIIFRVSSTSEAQGLKYESGSLIEVSTGNNVVFQDFNF